MKLAIGIPYHDNFVVAYKFMESLVRTIPGLFKEHDAHLFFRTGTLVSHVRNELLKDAHRSDFDAMLWIDSDVRFDPEDVARLVAQAADDTIVTGLYFTGDPPYTPNAYMRSETGAYRRLAELPGIPFEVDACGFGFLVMGRKAIYGAGDDPFNEMSVNGFHLGEDLSFCTRAKERGVKIYCDPTIKVGHLRLGEINESNWLPRSR